MMLLLSRAVAVVAARDPRPERLLAQLAPGGELQERLDAGAAERDRILALQAALLRGPARGGAGEIRQSGEIVLAKRHHVGLFVRQHVLAEGRAETGEAIPDLLQPLLGGRIKSRARAAEQRVVALQHARLLGGESGARGFVKRVEPGEQRRVEMDLVPVPGELAAPSRARSPGSPRWYARQPTHRRRCSPGRARAPSAPAPRRCCRNPAPPCHPRSRRSRPGAPQAPARTPAENAPA